MKTTEFYLFRTLTLNSWDFWQYVSNGVVETAFYLSTLTFGGKCFSYKKRSSFEFQTMSNKITATQQNFFARIINTTFSDKVQKKFWVKEFSFLVFRWMNSDITAKRQEIFAGIANTPLAAKVQKEDLRWTFWLKILFFIVFGHSMKSLRHVVEFFWQWCQNCILRVHSNILIKTKNWRENFFLQFRKLCEKFAASWQKSPGSSNFCSPAASKIAYFWTIFFQQT